MAKRDAKDTAKFTKPSVTGMTSAVVARTERAAGGETGGAKFIGPRKKTINYKTKKIEFQKKTSLKDGLRTLSKTYKSAIKKKA